MFGFAASSYVNMKTHHSIYFELGKEETHKMWVAHGCEIVEEVRKKGQKPLSSCQVNSPPNQDFKQQPEYSNDSSRADAQTLFVKN